MGKPKDPKYHKRYYRKHRSSLLVMDKLHYQKVAEQLRSIRRENKNLVFNYYGWKCVCCDETERIFLSIDHKNNDGHKERKGRGGSSDQIIRNIIKQNFPDTYQILCFNCNLGRARNKGICPHQII